MADAPERPVIHWSQRGSTSDARGACERQVPPGAKRDGPVTNLIAEQPERFSDAPCADDDQVSEEEEGQTNASVHPSRGLAAVALAGRCGGGGHRHHVRSDCSASTTRVHSSYRR